jgi:hypothetical protein
LGESFIYFRKLNEDCGKLIVEKGKMKGRVRVKQVEEEREREREKENK